MNEAESSTRFIDHDRLDGCIGLSTCMRIPCSRILCWSIPVETQTRCSGRRVLHWSNTTHVKGRLQLHQKQFACSEPYTEAELNGFFVNSDLLLPFHSSVLVPRLDLYLRQSQSRRQLCPVFGRQIFLTVEVLLETGEVVLGKHGSVSTTLHPEDVSFGKSVAWSRNRRRWQSTSAASNFTR